LTAEKIYPADIPRLCYRNDPVNRRRLIL